MSGPSMTTTQSPTPDNLVYGSHPIVTREVEIAASQTLTRGTIVARSAPKFSIAMASATGGTFTLSLLGVTTAGIAHNAAAAAVTSALEAVLGAGNVTSTGGALGTNPVVFTLGGALAGAGDVEATADGTLLTGTGAAVTVAEDATSQKITKVTSVPAAGAPLFVMAEPVTTGVGETAVAVAYESGHFNTRSIDNDGPLVAAITEHLRTKGIHLHESATNTW